MHSLLFGLRTYKPTIAKEVNAFTSFWNEQVRKAIGKHCCLQFTRTKVIYVFRNKIFITAPAFIFACVYHLSRYHLSRLGFFADDP